MFPRATTSLEYVAKEECRRNCTLPARSHIFQTVEHHDPGVLVSITCLSLAGWRWRAQMLWDKLTLACFRAVIVRKRIRRLARRKIVKWLGAGTPIFAWQASVDDFARHVVTVRCRKFAIAH